MADVERGLTGLQPPGFWRHFLAITTIARPSRQEDAIRAHVRAWAVEHGFAVAGDDAGNLVVRVPASAGREAAPVVVLQGHLDMVCERDPDSPFDPAQGRIGVRRDGDWLTADGTTLGADDGVALAAMMALAEDPALPHGPLELLMTAAEEVGLGGASALDPALMSGGLLLNLDSEEDGQIVVGSAGSVDSVLTVPGGVAALSGEAVLRVSVSGALGGHSGIDIAAGRANAIKALARVLSAAAPLRLVSLAGGVSRNAIPRDATAVVAVEEAAAFRAAVAAAAAEARAAHAAGDPGLVVEVSSEAGASPPGGARAWGAEDSRRALDVIALVPSGPLALSADLDGLVETSSSLGVASLTDGALELGSLTRSSNAAALSGVLAGLAAAARLAGGRFELGHDYGGWQPNAASPLLATARAVYERVRGEPAEVTAVHAGLEAAVIAERVPQPLDMISFGPQIDFPHSPRERLGIASVERFWAFLVALVDALSRPA